MVYKLSNTLSEGHQEKGDNRANIAFSSGELKIILEFTDFFRLFPFHEYANLRYYILNHDL